MPSEIFMGDMPEIMETIFKNLKEEPNSLFSCILVNRQWSKMTIPILWQDPFSYDKIPMFISRYFSSLNKEEKNHLKESGIIIEYPKTLNNYAKFLKVLDITSLENKTNQWVNISYINSRKLNINMKDNIANMLIKLFIENGATLRKLNFYISEFIIKPEIFYSLGKNDQFFTGLEELSVEAVSDFGGMDEAIMLLRILAKYTTKIITIKFKALDYHFEPQIYHAIAKIVKSQEQLKRFNLNCEAKSQTGIQGIISALEKQSKFLQEIRIKNCVYCTEFEVLMNCENLKVLRVLYCEQQKVLKVLETGDCRLNTLEISSCPIEGSSIIRILERSGTTLQRLKLDSIDQEIFSQQLLLETLIKFCPNIIYLYISYIKLCDQLFNLMSNSKNLQFLTLLWTDDRPEEEVKTQIIQLAKALPLNIQYLDLGNFWINSYIDVFLDHCNISLKKLLFSINFDQNYEKTIEALFKFWSRKRSLEEVNASLYESASVCENGSMLVGRYKSTNVSISSWGKLKKDLEEYVKLVPYEFIVVNC